MLLNKWIYGWMSLKWKALTESVDFISDANSHSLMIPLFWTLFCSESVCSNKTVNISLQGNLQANIKTFLKFLNLKFRHRILDTEKYMTVSSKLYLFRKKKLHLFLSFHLLYLNFSFLFNSTAKTSGTNFDRLFTKGDVIGTLERHSRICETSHLFLS